MYQQNIELSDLSPEERQVLAHIHATKDTVADIFDLDTTEGREQAARLCHTRPSPDWRLTKNSSGEFDYINKPCWKRRVR